MSRLSQIVPLSHAYLAEVLAEGDLAVDLTAGNGHDTLFLCRSVGETGCVLSFDLQAKALQNTRQRLAEAGFECLDHDTPLSDYQPGVHLVNASHDHLIQYVKSPPSAVIANLGYLPGGDKQIVTRPESTLAALQQAADLLVSGGRLSVVVYTGHAGGDEEGRRVDAWFSRLDSTAWDVLRINIMNRPESPYLLVAEKM